MIFSALGKSVKNHNLKSALRLGLYRETLGLATTVAFISRLSVGPIVDLAMGDVAFLTAKFVTIVLCYCD